MARKDFDTAHSRPHKATKPGTAPNVGVKRNLCKKAEYAQILVQRAARRARKGS